MTENQVGFGKARDFRVIRPVAKATTTAVKQKYNRELLLRRDGSGKHYAVLHFTAKIGDDPAVRPACRHRRSKRRERNRARRLPTVGSRLYVRLFVSPRIYGAKRPRTRSRGRFSVQFTCSGSRAERLLHAVKIGLGQRWRVGISECSLYDSPGQRRSRCFAQVATRSFVRPKTECDGLG
jgi:hypothetical protein